MESYTNNINNTTESVSLNHGNHFINKQGKVKNRTNINKNIKKSNESNKIEAFRGSKENYEFYKKTNSVKEQSNQLLNKNNDIQNQQNNIKALEAQYASLATQYKNIQSEMMGNTSDYISNKMNTGINVIVNSIVNNPTSTYEGVYVAGNDTMPLVSSTQFVSYDSCLQTALENGDTYFGLQGATSNNNSGLCSTGNNLSTATKHGKALSSCSQGNDNFIYGGPSVNAVYQTPGAQYVDTFNDSPNRAVPLINGGSQTYSYESCKQAATDGGYQFFALQNGNINGGAQCGLTNNFDQATAQGNTTNSLVASDGYTYGGGWANALYLVQSTTGNYIGCYNDNANNPAMDQADNNTNHSVATCQQAAINAGATYFAVQGGTNGSSKCYISNNLQATQQYGTAVPNITGTDGHIYGTSGTNAIYKVDQTNGNPAALGKAGYVNEQGNLSEYPSSMISNGSIINNDSSCPTKVVPIDSIQWDKYTKSNVPMSPSTVCGLAKTNEEDNKKLNFIESQMNTIANQIIQSIHTLQSYNSELLTQMGIDKDSLAINLQKYKSVNNEVSKYKSSYIKNVNGLLSDTDTLVLQESYSYMFWSILAIALITIVINTVRK